MSTKLKVLITLFVLLVGFLCYLALGGIDVNALVRIHESGAWFLPIVAIAALIDSINPCAFGVLLLTIGFLMSTGRNRLSILLTGATYILGIFIVYVLIGLGILQALSAFAAPHIMARIGASLIILAGALEIIGEFFPNFPIKLRIPSLAKPKIAALLDHASVPAAFLLGGLVGLFEFPCTGGPYLLVLGLLHDHETYMQGLGYLLFYNLIFVSPLIIILLIASDRSLIDKVTALKKAETKSMRLWGGALMILLGVIIFFL